MHEGEFSKIEIFQMNFNEFTYIHNWMIFYEFGVTFISNGAILEYYGITFTLHYGYFGHVRVTYSDFGISLG